MALFSLRSDRGGRFDPAEAELAEMPARLAEIATAAQLASDALRLHQDHVAQQRSHGQRWRAAEAHDELTEALIERVGSLRKEAIELATIVERAVARLAAMRPQENGLPAHPGPSEGVDASQARAAGRGI